MDGVWRVAAAPLRPLTVYDAPSAGGRVVGHLDHGAVVRGCPAQGAAVGAYVRVRVHGDAVGYVAVGAAHGGDGLLPANAPPALGVWRPQRVWAAGAAPAAGWRAGECPAFRIATAPTLQYTETPPSETSPVICVALHRCSGRGLGGVGPVPPLTDVLAACAAHLPPADKHTLDALGRAFTPEYHGTLRRRHGRVAVWLAMDMHAQVHVITARCGVYARAPEGAGSLQRSPSPPHEAGANSMQRQRVLPPAFNRPVPFPGAGGAAAPSQDMLGVNRPQMTPQPHMQMHPSQDSQMRSQASNRPVPFAPPPPPPQAPPAVDSQDLAVAGVADARRVEHVLQLLTAGPASNPNDDGDGDDHDDDDADAWAGDVVVGYARAARTRLPLLCELDGAAACGRAVRAARDGGGARAGGSFAYAIRRGGRAEAVAVEGWGVPPNVTLQVDAHEGGAGRAAAAAGSSSPPPRRVAVKAKREEPQAVPQDARPQEERRTTPQRLPQVPRGIASPPVSERRGSLFPVTPPAPMPREDDPLAVLRELEEVYDATAATDAAAASPPRNNAAVLAANAAWRTGAPPRVRRSDVLNDPPPQPAKRRRVALPPPSGGDTTPPSAYWQRPLESQMVRYDTSPDDQVVRHDDDLESVDYAAASEAGPRDLDRSPTYGGAVPPNDYLIIS